MLLALRSVSLIDSQNVRPLISLHSQSRLSIYQQGVISLTLHQTYKPVDVRIQALQQVYLNLRHIKFLHRGKGGQLKWTIHLVSGQGKHRLGLTVPLDHKMELIGTCKPQDLVSWGVLLFSTWIG